MEDSMDTEWTQGTYKIESKLIFFDIIYLCKYNLFKDIFFCILLFAPFLVVTVIFFDHLLFFLYVFFLNYHPQISITLLSIITVKMIDQRDRNGFAHLLRKCRI